MRIDFKRDLESEVKRIILGYGFAVPSFSDLSKQGGLNPSLAQSIPNYDLQNLLLHFFAVETRRVPIQKWCVHISKELSGHSSFGRCHDIIEKLKKGKNVNYLLSRKIRKLNQRKPANVDLLLYEWGVNHLHFSKNRSNELLFVFFKGGDAFLLNILPHEKHCSDFVTWVNTDLIQILHSNWPQTINDCIFKKNSKTKNLTPDKRKVLRKKSMNTTVVVDDGAEYLPPGGGFTGSKLSSSSIIKVDRLIAHVEYIEKVVKDSEDEIRASFSSFNSELDIVIQLSTDMSIILVEKNTKTRINLQYKDE